MTKDNKKSRFRYYPFLWINYFFIFLLLLANLSPYVAADVFWPISVLSLIAPAVILINSLFVLLWIIFLKRYYFYSLMVLLLSYSLILNHFQINTTNVESGISSDTSVSILTYNVCNLSHNNDHISDKDLRKKILDYSHGLAADIICFQEFQTYPTYRINTVKDYKKGLALKYVHTAQYLKHNTHKFLDLLVLYSKYPIINSYDFYMDGKLFGFYVDLNIKGKTYRMFNLHLESNHFEKNDYQIFSEKDTNFDKNKRNRISGLLEKLKKYSIKRSHQARLIKKEILKSPYPVLIAGDFNDTPASYTYQSISNGILDAFREKGSGYSNTYNGALPPMRIDYMLFDKLIKVNSYQVLEADLSDHFPVMVNVTLDGNKANN